MDDSTGKLASIEETLDEHRACMDMVSEVEHCLDRHPKPGGEWTVRLRAALTRLGETLRGHFAGEEQGPMFTRMPESHPRFAARLQKLKNEHAVILDRVREVLDRVNVVKDDARDYELREINSHAQLLIATLRRHEAEENEIVIAAHWDEVGVGD